MLRQIATSPDEAHESDNQRRRANIEHSGLRPTVAVPVAHHLRDHRRRRFRIRRVHFADDSALPGIDEALRVDELERFCKRDVSGHAVFAAARHLVHQAHHGRDPGSTHHRQTRPGYER